MNVKLTVNFTIFPSFFIPKAALPGTFQVGLGASPPTTQISLKPFLYLEGATSGLFRTLSDSSTRVTILFISPFVIWFQIRQLPIRHYSDNLQCSNDISNVPVRNILNHYNRLMVVNVRWDDKPLSKVHPVIITGYDHTDISRTALFQ
jgi:hypothetical protein